MKIDLVVGPVYSAVRQAAIVTSEESRGIDFTFGEGTLVLAGQTAEVGQSRIELPIAYDGQSISITLDPRFVSDFLKVLEPEKTFTHRPARQRRRRRLHHRRRLRLRNHAPRPRPLTAARGLAQTNKSPFNMHPAHPAATDFHARRDREQRRHYARRPKKIANVLAQLITARGYGRIQADADFAAAWQQAAGETIAQLHPPRPPPPRHTRSHRVANSMIIQELTFQKQQILTQLQTQLPDAKIRDIRFRVGSIS